jgi:hypothetical protein
MTAWSPDLARKTYSIPHWSGGYFEVDSAGRIAVRPKGAAGPVAALPEVVDAAMAQGAKLPMLVRFPDVLGDRLGKLQAAFALGPARTGTTPAATPRSICTSSNSTRRWPARWHRTMGRASGWKPAASPS